MAHNDFVISIPSPMPAYKLTMPSGDVYWVGRDLGHRTLVHSPARQLMDFGVIQLHVVENRECLVVDRLWPSVFPSLAMTKDEVYTAVLAYLSFLDKKITREIDELVKNMSRHRARKLGKEKPYTLRSGITSKMPAIASSQNYC